MSTDVPMMNIPAAAESKPLGPVAKVGHFLDACIRWSTELCAAVLVVAEVALLFANVFYRYALHDPLIWGDELATLLFIWLAMLGAVIALRRNEHMRLTTFIAHLSPSRRALVDTFGAVVVIAFMLALLSPAWDYVSEQWPITSAALSISDGYRVAALAVGLTLMLAISVARLMEQARPLHFLASFVVVGGIAAALMAFKVQITALGNWNLLIFFVGAVVFMIVIGIPIMVAFGLSTVAYLGTVTFTPMLIVMGRIDEGMSSLILLAIPLFVFLGALIEAMGMARAMIRFLASMIGHLRGGLSYVLVGAIYLVSGISGSKAADMAAVAPALFPEMKKRGEDENELVAMLSASGAMSETIPPSLVLITIGSVTGVSISALFTGGFMPAVVGAIAMIAVIWMKNRKREVKGVERAKPRDVIKAFFIALPALALPVVIRAAVVEGVATATEVASVGVIYTFVVGLLFYRSFDWKRLYPIIVSTASLSGAILIIIGCATAMAWALTQSGFSQQLTTLMAHAPGGATGFLIISSAAFVVLGSFLEGIPAIVLFGPLLFPVARSLGVNDVHYAMVAIFAMGLGLFAPPFGVGFYAACAVAKVNPDGAMKRVWPYLGALAVALSVLVAVPWVSTGFLS
ncbi:TRAP transporter large permease subunit [Paraburkholderia tagetis]|uniref:TRAP transporter large permease subunit n=1 Tax=Paraburkholderia tagetis TaxID=2913261 RepID=A0A9X1RLP2_9BURK|nr:TRAP transporter large permease subunit [Paraburkholderia tagetis]MCG5072081.1 TRAP transporter large permease subunit [Paraburkholderia tagetis]